MLLTCPQCGASMPAGEKFCTECGAPVAGQQLGTLRSSERRSLTTDPHDIIPFLSDDEAALVTHQRRRPVPLFVAAGIAALAVLVTIVVVFVASRPGAGRANGLFGAPSYGPPATGTAVPLTPSTLLDEASQAMSRAGSFHYTTRTLFYGLEAPSPGLTATDPLSITLQGSVRLPDAYTMTTTLPQLGEFVVISGTTWSRREGNPGWVQQPSADASLGLANPLGSLTYLAAYKSETLASVNSETREGSLLHHLKFDVDTARILTQGAGPDIRRALEAGRTGVEVWVRDSDRLLDRMTLTLTPNSGAGKRVTIETHYSDYNKEPDIRPPQ